MNVRFVFLGGAVVPLLVDHPTLMEFRPTKDVDVIVELISYPEFSAFEERLRAAGFKHDTSEGRTDLPLDCGELPCRCHADGFTTIRHEHELVSRGPAVIQPR